MQLNKNTASLDELLLRARTAATMTKRRTSLGSCNNLGTHCFVGLAMVLIIYDIAMHAALPLPAARLSRVAPAAYQVRQWSRLGAQASVHAMPDSS